MSNLQTEQSNFAFGALHEQQLIKNYTLYFKEYLEKLEGIFKKCR